MKALVLSAGGMYGAYQVGAWKALADVFQPDLIVGASIGAVNGWAIAGGCSPDELIRLWLNLEEGARYRWKFPAGIFGGILNNEPLCQLIRKVHEAFPPRVDCAVVLTDLLKLRPRIFRNGEVTWRHLAATTAIVGIFDQVRIDARIFSDGGLLAAVPLWAAAELGATKALVIDVLPEPPGLVAKTFVRTMKMLSPFRPMAPASLKVVRIAPAGLLGKPLEAIYWKRAKVEQWIHEGERDAQAIKHSVRICFEGE